MQPPHRCSGYAADCAGGVAIGTMMPGTLGGTAMRSTLLTTVDLLDRVKSHRGFTSDYQLWKALGWKQSTVSGYRVGRTTLSRAHALRLASEVGLAPEYVLACIELERETDAAVRATWQSIAAKFRRQAASIVLGALALGALTSPAPSEACPQIAEPNLYIM